VGENDLAAQRQRDPRIAASGKRGLPGKPMAGGERGDQRHFASLIFLETKNAHQRLPD
jgi:hypothetical protein